MMRLTLILVLSFNFCFGQTKFTAEHLQKSEHELEQMKIFCKQVAISNDITKKQVKHDKKKIEFLNSFYNKDLRPLDIKKMVRKLGYKYPPDSTAMGAVKKYVYHLSWYGNLKIEMRFSTFNNEIVYKKIYLETKTDAVCIDNPQQNYYSDVRYMQKHCFPYIDFPLKYSMIFLPARADTVLREKIAKLQTDQYKIDPNDSVNVHRETWDGADVYRINGDRMAVSKPVIKVHDRERLYQSLFSPNHIVALHAMEELTYLEETGQWQLPQEIKQKMEDLKNSDIEISTLYFDVGGSAKYKELKITKSMIVAKYKRLTASK
jgi:hypothetical protein